MIPTLKQFLQDETEKAEKKTILSTIRCKNNDIPHTDNDETANIQKILTKQSGMNYSPRIGFQKILVNMD